MSDNKTNLWWGPPKNFSDRIYERKVGWLELFYDLVYVAAIGQLTHQIAIDPSWHTVGLSFLFFSLVFWSWVNGSQYYDLHGNDGIRTRVFTLFQMLAIAAVAVTIHDAFEGYHQGLALSFAVIQALITYLWWSVGLYDPSHRVFNIYYTVNYSISFVLLLISVFTGHTTAIYLWIVILLLNLTPPITVAPTIEKARKETGDVFSASATMVERFGLFTIIVLAESILGIVSGIAEVHHKTPSMWLAFIMAILISFLLWSLYFDMTGEQETREGYNYMLWLNFLHFPLLASYCFIGGCIKVMISDMGPDLPVNIQWIFCISLATILFMIIGLTRVMKEEEEERSYIEPVSRIMAACGLIILVIPLFGYYLNSLAFLFIVAAILFYPVFVGVRRWVNFKFYSN
jgi:low temperature requirement protein LtrA